MKSFTEQNQNTLKMFIDVSSSTPCWFLDTNVWGSVVETAQSMDRFIQALANTNNLACLTAYSLFELSRAPKILESLDRLFFRLRHNIWVPLLYDFVYEAELEAYPRGIPMKWMPVSLLTGEGPEGERVMSKFSSNSIFKQARDGHLKFGHGRFMTVEKFKRNFPAKDPAGYSEDDAKRFARLNSIDYFRRHDPGFLRGLPHPLSKFQPQGIPSQFARSIFLFYKYYIHGKKPNKSDFMDFANVSYLPRVDYYVTERDVFNTLEHIRSMTEFFRHVTPIHIADFIATPFN